MMNADTSPIEAALLYRAAQDLTPETLVGILQRQRTSDQPQLKIVKKTENAAFVSDGQTLIAIESHATPRMAHKFIGIGPALSEGPENDPVAQFIQDHDAHIQIRIGPVGMAEDANHQREYFKRQRLCASVCQSLAKDNPPLAIHWSQPSQLLSQQQFNHLASTPLGLFVTLQPIAAPDSENGRPRAAYVVGGTKPLIGKQLRIGASTLTADDLKTSVTNFVETCIKHRQLPAQDTLYKTNTGMEFSVTHTQSEQNQDNETLELTPIITPNKVNVERHRDVDHAKPPVQPHPRRRSPRQDERDLRHAYRGQEMPKARKLTAAEISAARFARPGLRLVGSLAFLAMIGLSGALGIGVAVYGADGLGERVQSLWKSPAIDADPNQ